MSVAVKPVECSHPHFESTINRVYTHGFDKIYALKAIDPSTVKKIETRESVRETAIQNQAQHLSDLWDGQYELELGDDYRDWMPPLFLKEPVQMLGLSQRAEALCSERDVRRIEDLVSIDFSGWIGEKGVGQGHIDEIQQQLRQYINERSLDRTYAIDWGALIRSLTVGLERKKVHLLLQSFELEPHLPLTPIERMESLKAQKETQKVWIKEALQGLKQPENVLFLKETLSQISRVFLASWIRARGGAVHLNEVVERGERVSEEKELVSKASQFLTEVYQLDAHPLTIGLIAVEQEVFCSDLSVAHAYREICQKAKSYFCRAKNVYRFHELLDLLAKEFGAHWKWFPRALAEASLKKSPCFRVRKGESGKLEVRLHFWKA